MKGVHAKTADAKNNMMGFGSAPDDDEEPAGGARGGRGGRGRGGMRQRDSIVDQGRKR